MVLHFYLVTRATAGTFTSDVWEQLQVEDLPSAVAVTASGQMLGKSLQQWAQNYTRQLCPLTSFYLSLRQALHHLKSRAALKALVQRHRTRITAAR